VPEVDYSKPRPVNWYYVAFHDYRPKASGQNANCAASRTCGLEALHKVLLHGKIDPALLDSLRSCLISEPAAHQALHLVLRQGLQVPPGRQGIDQARRQKEEYHRFAESRCHLARLS
jgi:hypothetical protein